MPSRTVAVGSATGLHARPAQIVSAAAAESEQTVLIGRVGQEGVDASSILMLMSLGLGAGEDIVLSCDDDLALERIADLIAKDLDAS
ncbi:HPr family phosphocarrier protein [Glutamicibacter halophytocola]|uniref:HPr family phosphocarrier protein n=1 Tax=Glutamicibacter halophytocola TaxID=1933880 RepID=UPI003219AB1A